MVKQWYSTTAFPFVLYFTDEFRKNGTSKFVVCILLYAEQSAVAVWRPAFQWVQHLQASSLWRSATPPVAPELHETAVLPLRCLPTGGSYKQGNFFLCEEVYIRYFKKKKKTLES